MLLPLIMNLPEFAVNLMTLTGNILSSRVLSLRGGGVLNGDSTFYKKISSGSVVKLRGGSYQK